MQVRKERPLRSTLHIDRVQFIASLNQIHTAARASESAKTRENKFPHIITVIAMRATTRITHVKQWYHSIAYESKHANGTRGRHVPSDTTDKHFIQPMIAQRKKWQNY